jgi:multiple sugar transport system ATP-binding protein
MVFQFYALYPHLRVRGNIAFPLRAAGLPAAEIERRVEAVADQMGLRRLLSLYPQQLSGGDQQKVSLARAMVRRPAVFLMDEPLGTLDAEFRDLMREELRQLHERIGATTVYVTHDQIEAMSMADVIAVMSKGEVLQVGPPVEIYNRPATMFVAGFIGSPAMNFLPVAGPVGQGAQEVRVNGSMVQVPQLREALPHEQGVLGARPEHIQLADSATFRGRVFGVEYMGARQLVTVDTSAGRLRVRASNTVRPHVGDTVGLAFRTESLILFDGQNERALASDLMKANPNG